MLIVVNCTCGQQKCLCSVMCAQRRYVCIVQNSSLGNIEVTQVTCASPQWVMESLDCQQSGTGALTMLDHYVLIIQFYYGGFNTYVCMCDFACK